MKEYPVITIEEKILQHFESVQFHLMGVRFDIRNIRQDDPEGEKTAELTDRLESLTDIVEIYMQTIQTLLAQKLYSAVEIRKLHDRVEALEDAVLAGREKQQARRERTSRRVQCHQKREAAQERMRDHLLKDNE